MSHHVKTAEGYDVKVPSQGQVDFATVGGALGLASFAGINAGNILPGWGGGWNNADAFRELSKDIDYKVNLEAERRNCADQKIVNYVNATFAPKLVTDYTAGTTSAAMTLYNPLCACSDRN